MFEHSVMRKVSGRISDSRIFPFTGEDPKVVQNLKTVAQVFVELQDNRHIADYDNTIFWTRTEALREVTTAAKAFSTWQAIKNKKIAQDYLVSLLIKPRD
jgi:hemerythrin-like domain-containing protein